MVVALAIPVHPRLRHGRAYTWNKQPRAVGPIAWSSVALRPIKGCSIGVSLHDANMPERIQKRNKHHQRLNCNRLHIFVLPGRTPFILRPSRFVFVEELLQRPIISMCTLQMKKHRPLWTPVRDILQLPGPCTIFESTVQRRQSYARPSVSIGLAPGLRI